VTPKSGGTGDMVFVTVAHQVEGENGAFLEEEQDIVYLHIPDRYAPPKRLPELEAPDFDETVTINEARLFRFSAATYNAHRIHYDLPYAQEVEKYPALVTHGPMQAIMLMEAAKRHTGEPPKPLPLPRRAPDVPHPRPPAAGQALRRRAVDGAGHGDARRAILA
jgi:3-methylfumaryl-CoA hydratase